MLNSIRQNTQTTVFATLILALCSNAAWAQNGSQRSSVDEHRCQATNTNPGSSTQKADLESTYSACSLVDGFIGFGARINDGIGDTSGFGSTMSDQLLGRPELGENGHRLASQLGEMSNPLGNSGARLGRTTGNYTFGTRDFVALENNQAIEDAGGYRGSGRNLHSANGSSDEEAFVGSPASAQRQPAGGNGIGGGGANGGIDSGSKIDVTPIPAIPEPQSYALMLAGLALLAAIGKRSRKKI